MPRSLLQLEIGLYLSLELDFDLPAGDGVAGRIDCDLFVQRNCWRNGKLASPDDRVIFQGGAGNGCADLDAHIAGQGRTQLLHVENVDESSHVDVLNLRFASL